MEDNNAPQEKRSCDPQEFLDKHRARSREYKRKIAATKPLKHQCEYVSARTGIQCIRRIDNKFCAAHKLRLTMDKKKEPADNIADLMD